MKTSKNKFKIRFSSQLIANLELINSAGLFPIRIASTLVAIAEYWNSENKIFPSQLSLAERTGFSTKTIGRHVAKAVELKIIKSEQRPNLFNGIEQIRQTNQYFFNEKVIATYLTKAFKVLKAKQEKEKLKAAFKEKRALKKQDKTELPTGRQTENKSLEKCPTATVEKCPPILVSLNKDTKVKKITDKSKSNLSVMTHFIQRKIEALQNELTHLTKLQRKSAYQAGVTRNKIAQGLIFSKAEIKQRERQAKVQSKKTQANNKVFDLMKQLISKLTKWKKTKHPETFSLAEANKLNDIGTKLGLSFFDKANLVEYFSFARTA